MTALESRDYQDVRDRIKGNPVIAMMAAGVAAVPLAEITHQDGTPRFAFLQQANRAFDDAEARNAGNPAYTPYPKDAHRHLGLIAEAILAARTAIRAAVASAMAPPGTDPESDSLSSQPVEVLAAIFRGQRQMLAISLYGDPAAGLCGDAPAEIDEHAEHGLVSADDAAGAYPLVWMTELSKRRASCPSESLYGLFWLLSRGTGQCDILATIWSSSVVLGGLAVSEPWIGLSDAIAALRAELATAMSAGESERLRFELGPVELEFTVDVHKDGGADGGIRWGVVSFGAQGSAGSADGHRVKLVLQPKDVASGGNAEVGSSRR
jgi:hypothetical protein